MESASDLIRQVDECNLKIASLEEERANREHQHILDVHHVRYEVYQEQIYELERRRDKEIEELRETYENLQRGTQSGIETAMGPIKQVERILDFLRISPYVDPINDDAIMPYRNHGDTYKEALPYLFESPHLKIRLFIVENKKPVNKYSLAALGNTSFPESLLKLEHSYGCDFYTPGGVRFDMEMTLKDAPAVEVLKVYLERSRRQIEARLKGNYDEVEAEWEQVLASYKVEDFQSILVWKCVCRYFSTTMDGSNLQKSKTCPRCGAGI